MNWDAIGAAGEIIGALAVVLTLIYLAIQTRQLSSQTEQNTKALIAGSRLSALRNGHAELFNMVEFPDLVTDMANPDGLNEQQQARISAFYFVLFRSRELAWGQEIDGLIDERQWQTELAVLHFLLDSQLTRDWWVHTGRPCFSEEFAGFVDRQLSVVPVTNEGWKSYTNWHHNENASVPDEQL